MINRTLIVKDLAAFHDNRFYNDHPHDRSWDGYVHVVECAVERLTGERMREAYVEYYAL